VGAAVAVALLVAACSGSEVADDATTIPDQSVASTDVTTSTSDPTTTDPASTEPGCDDRMPRACLLPWPNDRYTVADPSTVTGRRLAIPEDGSPRNADGVGIDTTDQNRADGFSPASAILLDAPGVDLTASRLPDQTDIGASLDDEAGIRVTDLNTGERWPYWAELDADGSPGDATLILRPAVALTETHRYQVEVVDIRRSDDAPVDIVLPLTFEFTVASADSLSGRLRSMVDGAAGYVPDFEVTNIDASSDPIIVEGTYAVPNHLDNDGSTGGKFLLDDDGLPLRNESDPTWRAPFLCLLGSAPSPKPSVVYGHGLLGSRGEVTGLAAITTIGGLNACATDWIGMSTEDLVTVGTALGELSTFPAQADRMQQGHLAFVLLGRLLNRPEGFASHPAFQAEDGTPLVATDGAVFVGSSQGGILGGAPTAVADEWDRAVFAVPGVGYNLLLYRSSNWPRFRAIFDVAYPDPLDRLIALELIQLLWDRGENSGYAQHITNDPYPGRRANSVLLIESFGDHQVANVSTQILARTIGAAVREPVLDAGRSTDVEPYWGIERLDGYPTQRSVLSVWDFGTPPSPIGNTAPFAPDYGKDPHGAGSSETNLLLQAVSFLASGEVIDTCGGGPCLGRRIDD
jgi:hypothetical protein